MHYHTREIFDRAPLAENASPADIRRLIDNVEHHFDSLKRLFPNCKGLDAAVMWSVFSHLDKSTQRKWEIFISNDDVEQTWNSLMNFLRKM